MFVIFGYISFTIYNDPGSVVELTEVGSQGLTDMVAWGRTKIGIDPLKDDPFRPKSFAEEMLMKGITEEDLKEDDEEGEEKKEEEVEGEEKAEEVNDGQETKEEKKDL